MPRLSPFAGVRYSAPDGRLDDLVAPPYDVIDAAAAACLAGRSEHNAVRLESPEDEAEQDRYALAASRWTAWRRSGVLVDDPEPAFYVYRMGFHDPSGRPRQTTGVIGALELSDPGDGQILPHEHTTPKDKADRLQILRACQANLSPIWVLSPTVGLSALCEPSGPPDARATDEDGTHHRLWRVTAPGLVGAIADLVASAPVIVADGHHRFEIALVHRDQRRLAGGGEGDEADAVMAYVVELADEQLLVQAIHRLIGGLPAGFDLLTALSHHFALTAFDGGRQHPSALLGAMSGAGALGLAVPAGWFLLHPNAATDAAAGADLDSSRLAVALGDLAAHEVTYQHGAATVVAAVAAGRADAAVLLRPASVDQIAATGRDGRKMP
ncbi:MAG: DUF1015 domain-containing protein, partial [Acidimicrobiales bacterium]